MFVSANTHNITPVTFVKLLMSVNTVFQNSDIFNFEIPGHRERLMEECCKILADTPASVIGGEDTMGCNFIAHLENDAPVIVLSMPEGYIRLHVEH